jgi:sugar O-acyltransferase (sialic acid O-acetyltransferase NeuD family)
MRLPPSSEVQVPPSTQSRQGILVVGAGGHAVSCIDVIEKAGIFRVVGLVASAEEVGAVVCGYDVLMTDDDLDASIAGITPAALVAVGQIKTAGVRIRLFNRLRQLGFALPVIISPNASISERTTLGAGTIAMHGCVINAGVDIGENCIINSCALIEHGARIGAHCHVATRAIVNGDATIGEGTFVDSGAVLRHGIRIGRHCVIGMGAVVRNDVPDDSTIRTV